MSSFDISPQEQRVMALFRRKAERTLVALRRIYAGLAVKPAQPDHALTAIIRSLNRKLRISGGGRIERISGRGRGHAGKYLYKVR